MAPGWIIAATVALMFACGDMRQDELDCEEAVSHLRDCCPGFDTNLVDCTYFAPQGCGTTTYPDIPIGQSQCISGETCGSLVASGVCKRMGAATRLEPATGPRSQFYAVCP